MLQCKSCAGKLVYDITQGKLKCKNCGITYKVEEAEPSLSEQWKNKPQYILPFSVTEEEAVKKVQKRFEKSIFVPWKLKHFQEKEIRGVYVPFWIYDIFFRDSQLVHVKVKTTKSGYSYDSRVNGRVDFEKITASGIKGVRNELSQKLEPYDLSKLETFHEGYLAGFYADAYDLNSKEAESAAIERCKKLFDRETDRNMARPLGSHRSVKESAPCVKVRNVSCALLPVWFVSVDYKKRSYTWLVNGQTGKVIGTAPFAKWRAAAFFAAWFAFFMQFLPEWCSRKFADNGDTIYVWLIMIVIILLGGMMLSAYFAARIGDTTAGELREYVLKHREER